MSKLKILVIDDEPGIRSGVIRILQNHRIDFPFMDEPYEFEMSEAASGEKGIEIIRENQPDIVLLDNKLPGIQGTDVLEYIKKCNLKIVVAMITSYASLELAVKATKDGANDFIPKPFTPQELKSSIENICKQIFLKRIITNLNTEGKQTRFQFLQILSHELKAPLNAIEGYLKIMQKGSSGEHIEDYSEMIDRSLVRINGMRTLIMDLLDLTKIESNKKTRDVQQLNAVPLLMMSVETIKPYAIQRDIEIETDTPENASIFCDREEIEIIFNNLLNNAVKYNKESGKIEVLVKEMENYFSFIFTDTGIGMSEAEIKMLFKEFSRIKNEKTKHITGSGLGLSIVKKLVELNSGEISVDSKPDVGTTFTVLLKKHSPETK